jgi:hypothetical protein
VRAARAARRAAATRVHVAGAQRWRDPDEDLPGDFDENRDVHYAAIRKPRDPAAFIADLKRRLHAGLERLDHAISSGTAGGVRIATRHGKPSIVVPPLGRLPEPPNLKALHGEIQARHGTINLLDVLKDADHTSRFTLQLTSVASREITDPETARRRKLLVSFGIGSNIRSSGSPTRSTVTPPTPRPRCAASGASTSTATACVARSPRPSTRRSRSETPCCGARAPPARLTPSSSARGTPT